MENNNIINNQQPLFRIRDILSLILFILSISCSIYIITFLFHFPLEQLRVVSYLILFFSLAITVFLGIGLLRYFTKFTGKSWIFYIFQFLIALLLPLVLIGSIEGKVKEKILALVTHDMSPIITYIENHKKQNGNLPKELDKALVKFPSLRNIAYYHNDHTFILKTSVPSIDIDGAKIFYDSRDKQWYQFHNDEKSKISMQYISFVNQAKQQRSYIKNINGKWIDPIQEEKLNDKKI